MKNTSYSLRQLIDVYKCRVPPKRLSQVTEDMHSLLYRMNVQKLAASLVQSKAVDVPQELYSLESIET